MMNLLAACNPAAVEDMPLNAAHAVVWKLYQVQ